MYALHVNISCEKSLGVVVHGCGLDEISPLGRSTILEVRNINPANKPKKYEIKKYTFDPMSVGIPRCKVEDLKGGNADENALQVCVHTCSSSLFPFSSLLPPPSSLRPPSSFLLYDSYARCCRLETIGVRSVMPLS